MNIIKYERDITMVDFETDYTIFLAGPTVRGHQTHLKSWREDAIEIFKEKQFIGTLIVPEFFSKTESDKYRYDIPQWEFYGLRNCDVIMFWIPRTRELIGLTTNFELGYWISREREKVVYGRPDDAYRMTYCDIMWVEDCKNRGWPTKYAQIHNTLEKTIDAALEMPPE